MRVRKVVVVLTVLVLLLNASVPFASAGQPAPVRAQPQLLELAAGQPEQTVSVIVQKAGQTSQPEQRVLELGGKVTSDLRIINAFAAELSAASAILLSAEPSVKWVSLNAGVVKSGRPGPKTVSQTNAGNAYLDSIRASALRQQQPDLNGSGITVAVVDSGISLRPELEGRLLADVLINSTASTAEDGYGHGTHIAGIIGGTGFYEGVAPGVNLINVKVSADNGGGTIADVVAGLQWIYDNRDAYNIRVVNISINSSVVENYFNSPLDAAVEVLWFDGIVVVVSSGNNGKPKGILYPPANDPFVITVGSVDDQGTPELNDDVLSSYTASGNTENRVYKPEILAPGSDIYSLLASSTCTIAVEHPANVVDGQYLRLSGTSMSAAVTSGAVALLLQDEPGLTPDQVKYRLMSTGKLIYGKIWSRYLDIEAAVNGTSTQSANTGRRISNLLTSAEQNVTTWDSVAWNSVAWNSVAWNSVAWNSVAWNSVAWNSLVWNE